MNTLMKKTNGNLPATSFSSLVDKLFQNNLNRVFEDDFWGFGNVSQHVSVPVNIRETDKSYELHVVAPGLKKENFKINVQGNMLTVSVEHQEEQNQQNNTGGWLRNEYQKRSFTCTFNLDDAIDAGTINAKYSDGILELSLPKREGAQTRSRTIEIK